MRIAQLSRMLPRADYAGGVSGQVDLLSRALVSRGHDVTVFAVNPPPEPAPYTFSRVHIPPRFVRATPLLFGFALSRLPLDDFDVVHSHGDDHLLRLKPPLVRTFHGSSWAETKNAIRLKHRLYHLTMGCFERISEWRADAIAVDASETNAHLRRRALVVPCTYDGRRFFPGGTRSGNPTILFVGDLDTRKRGRLLLDVFQTAIRRALPDAELWIVSGDRVSAEGVRCFGRVGGSELGELYRRAWVFCLPSSYEGFGVPYIEAMACGTPVVATHNGGADEILDLGRYGLLAGENELAGTLLSVLQNPELRSGLGHQAVERARMYSMDRMAAGYESVYESVLRSRGELAMDKAAAS
jgi:glycosyltransferase involved in cell wall biosynthesis